MLHFPDNYFEPEVRCGYFISEKMKRFWAASLEVYDVVNTIAQSYGFTIYADFGTLLGAVRHGGFVPWDDDLDFSMKREEFNAFLETVSYELPEGYAVYSMQTDDAHYDPKAFICNSQTYNFSPEFLKRYHGCPFLTGIDIFPLDTVPDDPELWDVQLPLLNTVYDTAHRFDELRASGELDTYLPQIEEYCQVKLDYASDVKAQLWRLSDKLASLAGAKEGSRIAYMTDILSSGERKIREKSWYRSTVDLDFEVTTFRAPAGYHSILSSIYGYYPKLVRGRSRHGYPVYKLMDPNGKYLVNPYVPDGESVSPAEDDPLVFVGKKVLFLLRESEKWGYFDGLYRAALSDGAEFSVIALPYRFKDDEGNPVGDWICEKEALPDDVLLRDADDYDIATEKPDVVLFQDPFDTHSLSTEIDPRFFASEIRPHCENLICVPPFEPSVQGSADEMSEEMMTSFFKTPGIFLSNNILLRTPKLKELALKIFEANEDSIWNQKITVLDAKRYPAASNHRFGDKKVILFADNIGHFIGKEDLFDAKYTSIISAFTESKDSIHVLWCQAQDTLHILPSVRSDVRAFYSELTRRLKNQDWCTFYDTVSNDTLNELVSQADAAYGAPGSLLIKCFEKKIPVMEWNLEVT